MNAEWKTMALCTRVIMCVYIFFVQVSKNIFLGILFLLDLEPDTLLVLQPEADG